MAKENDIILRVNHLTKLYGANKSAAYELIRKGFGKEEVFKKTGVTIAVNDISFEVKRGKIYVLIGLSGSGKSTVVRCLNGLVNPSGGDIYFEGQNIKTYSKKEFLEYRRNKISMIFQSFGLMSHRDVFGNVVYGLEVRGMPRQQRENRAMEMIAMVGLEGWEHKSISSLSGGMRQRVGIARALANGPDILLMDEPFSALDPLVRRDMEFELLSLQKKLNKTIIFITHDINEAFKLGDLVSIMKDGKIIQTDTPEGMSAAPADDYVENFINSADKAQIYSVHHIMQKPACLIHMHDGVNNALKQMQAQGLSSAYVVGDELNYVGILPLDRAIKVKRNEIAFDDAVIRNMPTTTKDTQIADILSMAASAQFPIAVVDEKKRLEGIVTKAAVLTALVKK